MQIYMLIHQKKKKLYKTKKKCFNTIVYAYQKIYYRMSNMSLINICTTCIINAKII